MKNEREIAREKKLEESEKKAILQSLGCGHINPSIKDIPEGQRNIQVPPSQNEVLETEDQEDEINDINIY